MKTFELEVDDFQTPGQVVQFLEENNLQKGDVLKVMTDEDKANLLVFAVIMIIAIAIAVVFKKQKDIREGDGERVLDDVFKGKTIEEIEQQVEEEYGIKIEVGQKEDDEEKQWRTLSSTNFLKGYSENEPDYTDADIKEPNPQYKVWREK